MDWIPPILPLNCTPLLFPLFPPLTLLNTTVVTDIQHAVWALAQTYFYWDMCQCRNNHLWLCAISKNTKQSKKKKILVSYCPRCEVPPFWLHCTLIISAVVVLGLEGTYSAVHAQCTASVSSVLIIPHTALDSLQCFVDTGWLTGFHLCSDLHKLNAARSSPLWTYISAWIPTA